MALKRAGQNPVSLFPFKLEIVITRASWCRMVTCNEPSGQHDAKFVYSNDTHDQLHSRKCGWLAQGLNASGVEISELPSLSLAKLTDIDAFDAILCRDLRDLSRAVFTFLRNDNQIMVYRRCNDKRIS